jgi:hypothetical protein
MTAAARTQLPRSMPQARFWRESETTEARNDHVAHSTGRMAKIRLPIKVARKIRRKHGCDMQIGHTVITGTSNIVTTILRATVSIASNRQRNIHDVTIDTKGRAQLLRGESIRALAF